MEPEEIRDLMLELQSPSLDMDSDQLSQAHRACAVLEDICTVRCREVVKLAGKGPLLQIYLSDGWSVDMRDRVGSAQGDVRVDRIGRMRTEFVLQRAILKCIRGDTQHLAIKIQRPRPLHTKKCSDIFAACCEFVPVLPLSGHQGISIHVYLQDGLFAKPFGRRMIARHSLFWQRELCPLSFVCEPDRILAEL